jgi:hypothetical protein
MVQGLIAQSGGAMEISSQLGRGTVVKLWLPRARREDVRQVREPGPKRSVQNASRGGQNFAGRR